MRAYFLFFLLHISLYSTEIDKRFQCLCNQLSFQNIMCALDDFPAWFTFYNLDGLGALSQGTKSYLQLYLKGLKPLPIVNHGVHTEKLTGTFKDLLYGLPNFPNELRNVQSPLVLYIFAYVPDAFGKEGDPLFLYVSHMAEKNEITPPLTLESFDYSQKLSTYRQTCSMIDFLISSPQYDCSLFFKMCEKLSVIGIIDAQLACAMAYYHVGIYKKCGVEKNISKAFSYWKAAADQECATAQYNCGILLYNGEEVEQNIEKAFYYFEESAKNGCPMGQLECGLAYGHFESYNCPKDFEKAFYYFKKAADQGCDQSQTKCGIMYRVGLGTQVDVQKSLAYFELAANQGDKFAQYECALIYAKLNENPSPLMRINTRKAFYYAKKSADQGYKDACTLCANMYFYGTGTKKNFKRSAYYRKLER